jgi:hypothetical protein
MYPGEGTQRDRLEKTTSFDGIFERILRRGVISCGGRRREMVCGRLHLERIHLDVAGRLTPSKNGNQEIHNTPTCTPRLGHSNLTTPTWKPILNTAPTCTNSITNTNLNLQFNNNTNSAPTSFQRQYQLYARLHHQLQLPLHLHPSLQHPHSSYNILSIFLLRQGEF